MCSPLTASLLASLLLAMAHDPPPPSPAGSEPARAPRAAPPPLSGLSAADQDLATVLPGAWIAHLDSPGGELRFGLEFAAPGQGRGESPSGKEGGAEPTTWAAWLVNGIERIPVPRVELSGDRLTLGMDHYDSRITARWDGLAGRLIGRWSKRRSADSTTEMDFGARRDNPGVAVPRPGPEPPVSGRWRVRLQSDEQAAVGLFQVTDDGSASGTFLTTTGDYRYLAGWQVGPRLSLSCFDGAHAFLFDARVQLDGSLAGDFWSRDTWHETWSAVRDEQATLPDGFALTRWTDRGSLHELIFPDLDGTPRALDNPAFAGKARILQVFGSWCPNCHDASEFMSELDGRYRAAGLSIVGLAFELTGDFERDAEQVRRYAARHHVSYPLLVAGLADKAQASAALPVLDAVRSYPTTIFLHGDGRVRAVYQGFSGPATGEAHQQLRAAFIALIEELLAEGD